MSRRKKIVEKIRIEKVADKGKGMGFHDGKVVFVEKTVPGDLVDVRLTRNRKKFSEGYPLEFHEYSKDRVEPFCEHFGHCGGCRWQNLPYSKQLDYKTQIAAESMQHIGKLHDLETLPSLGAEPDRYYRNKLDFTFSDRRWLTQEQVETGEVFERDALGFHVPRHFDRVLDISHCHLQPEPSNKIRVFVRRRAIELGIPFFNPREHTGNMRNLTVRNNRAGDFMVILSVVQLTAPVKVLLDELAKEFAELKSIFYVENTKGNSTTFDLEMVLHSGVDHITETLTSPEGPIQYRIGPKSFFQTNPSQTEVLYDLAAKYAEIGPQDRVYDLYTGLGSIALFLAKQAKEVIGIELIEDAIADAKANAKLNSIDNCKFFAGDMSKMLTGEFVEEHGNPDVVITDPPRAGMHPDVVAQLAHCRARRIVYVSCNPATQARDLEWLSEQYIVRKVQPVDMFPHTFHIESIAVLDRRD